MPRIVLLPVSGSTADPEVFAMALTVARTFDSHLVALHVRPDVRRDIASLAASDGGMTAGIDTMLEQMEADADTREKAASDGWHAFCSQNNIARRRRAGRKRRDMRSGRARSGWRRTGWPSTAAPPT